MVSGCVCAAHVRACIMACGIQEPGLYFPFTSPMTYDTIIEVAVEGLTLGKTGPSAADQCTFIACSHIKPQPRTKAT